MNISERPDRRGRRHTIREAARDVRRELVHAAGCTEEFCATKYWLRELASGSMGGYQGPAISVPRSLRSRIGRFIGWKK
jgi:hypothetical protein